MIVITNAIELTNALNTGSHVSIPVTTVTFHRLGDVPSQWRSHAQ
jgi:hypothetical protein